MSVKRGFIRGLWGIFDRSHRLLNRRYSVDDDINTIMGCKFNEPFTTYVMGEDNYKSLIDKGIEKLGHKVVLVHKDPFMFDLIKYQYRHKIEIIKYAMEVDGYDEIVYLDWDCIPQKNIPGNFWEEQGKKESLQACLQYYKRPKCPWRAHIDSGAVHEVPNGGYLYIRDKTIPSRAVKIWENEVGQPDNDEIAWAKLTDDMFGGWKNNDFFYDKFETMYCNLHRMSPIPVEKRSAKDICFLHFQG
jgi:hypothetical protein